MLHENERLYLLQSLNKYNPWDKISLKQGLIRSDYLKALLKYQNNNLIKVLIGQRRVGKSFILKQFIHKLIKRKSVNPENILYVNFEFLEFQSIDSKNKLADLIELFFAMKQVNKKQKVYFIFDEIQEVESWERLLSSILADDTYDKEIYITGSNSKLLSSDLATYITGRHVTLNIFPFSFDEFLSFHKEKRSKNNFLKYVLDSQLPELLNIEDKQIRTNYMMSIKDSILLKDIVARYGVSNIDLLEKIFFFLADNIGNLFSLNSLVKKLVSAGYKTNVHTLGVYVHYLEESMLIQGVQRFDVKGKKILDGEKKYYLTDLGFRQYLFSDYDSAYGKILENYVFNYLRQRGYEVHVGKLRQYEIDFIASKGKRKIYVQVAYLLYDDDVIKREFGNLEKIDDHWDKYVISLDDIKMSPRNGIEHLQVWDLECL